MRHTPLTCGLCLSFFISATVFAQQGDVVSPNENLVVEGLPPISASMAERAGRYTEFRSAELLDWHPKRREVLIGTRFADTLQVHHVANPLGDRRQLTFFPDRVMAASYRPHQGDYFLLSN